MRVPSVAAPGTRKHTDTPLHTSLRRRYLTMSTISATWPLTGRLCPCGATTTGQPACASCGATGTGRDHTATGHITTDTTGAWLTIHDTTGRLSRKRISHAAADRFRRRMP